MRRTTRHTLLALAAALLLAAAGGLVWLAGTTHGARWLMTAVSRHTRLSVSARQVEGRLFDHLRLAGVRVTLPRGEAELDSLELRWRPLLLLAGEVAVRELTLRGVRVQDNTPAGKEPPDLGWPRLPRIATLFDGGAELLRVDGLSYRHLDGEPLAVNSLATSLAWRDMLLSLADLSVSAPAGSVTGSVLAGFRLPSLKLDLAVTPAEPVAALDRFSLQARLLPGRAPEQLAGRVRVASGSGPKPRLELAGEVGMTHNSFNLRDLRLTSPGRRGVASGAGTILLTTREPVLELRLKGSGLDLAPELRVATDLAGELTFRGTPARYRGQFALASRGKGWRTARLTGSFQGDRAGVRLARLAGSLLDGTVQGDINIGWRAGLSLEGAITGRNLNPVRLDPRWSGVVNFDLRGKTAWSEGAPPRGEVSGTLRESRLHGKALTGDVRADFADNNLRVGRLALQGEGFEISAAGELARRLAFSAQVSDLARLVPGTAGELAGEGWLRWSPGSLSGFVTGQGRNLAADGVRIAAAELAARLGEGRERPVQATASLRTVEYDRFRVDTATLAVAGTTLRHTIDGTLRTESGKARFGLAGGYRQGSWQGEIVSFSGRDDVGPWNLTAPARLAITAGSVSLSSLAITGSAEERLELAGELTRNPLAGVLRAEWSGVNLARANRWLEGMAVTGSGSGKVELRLLADERLAVAGSATVAGTVAAEGQRVTIERGALTIDGGERGITAGIELALAEGGMLKGTLSSPRPARLALPEEGEVAAEWQGIDLLLLRPWLSSELRLDGRLAGRVAGRLSPAGQLDLRGSSSLSGGAVRWQREQEQLDATLQTADISWVWQGTVRAGALEHGSERLAVTGRATGAGSFTTDGERLAVQRGSLEIAGNGQGLRAGVELSLPEGGTVKGTLSTPSPVRLAIPEEGEVAAEWEGVDLALLRPWFPRELLLEGRLAGRISGKLLPAGRIDLRGDSTLSMGRARWQRAEGELNAELRSATVSASWQGETLRGTFALALAEYGEARGEFQLPLPARLPASLDPKGAVQASLTGQVREKGILTTLFPGLIQESGGELGFDLRAGGNWGEPRLEGNLRLAKAGAYLPAAGIHVREVELAARLEKDLIRIDSFRAASGPGHIEGTAVIRLQGWRVTGYRGSMSGERFQVVYLPELQLLASPRLDFEGAPEKVAVRGEIRLPELLVFGPPARAPVAPSTDVVVEGASPPAEKALPIALDVQIRVELGDRVLVKAEGIDAQLGGRVELALQSFDKITSRGEIRVVKGRYRTYGIDLEIVRGHLFYTGGPFGRPILDILALRTADDVRAGVTVGGTPQAPVIKLYSEPTMPDVDIMAYIVLGHPLGSSREQASLVAQAAGFLFSTGQSVILRDQIRERLGLTTLEIQTGGAEPTGRMGYQAIPLAPPAGAAPVKPAAGISQPMLTVGKYLTPKLYFSYGRSLFTGDNLFRLRYDIFKRLQVETETGAESGVDLFYKIDFN